MIINEYVKIVLNNRNKKRYENKGYDVSGDIIYLKIDDLSRNSQIKITVKCDVCAKEKETTYQLYMNSFENNNIYACSYICGREKSKLTNMEKYGVENVSQIEDIKKKKIETNLKNWGTENVFQNKEIIKISKNTKKEKYGDENYRNFKKRSKTCLEKYGVEYPIMLDEFKEKRNINNKEKYGVEHYQQTKEYLDEVKITNNEKYGVDFYLQSDDKKTKSKMTCLIKYGVEYPLSNIDVREKINKTKILTGSYKTKEQRTDYKNYWLLVKSITDKFRLEVYNNWSGYDYYDGEYIKEYLKLNYDDKLYPTIDHKISIKYGYINKILPEIIGDVTNLCITKRTINSRKSSKNNIV